jgi:hypothetical protein
MSITLGTPFTTGGGGTNAESDASAALVAFHADFQALTLTAIYALGTATTSGGKTTAFVIGTQAQQVSVTFNLAANTWSRGLFGAPSALSAGEISALQTLFSNSPSGIRNLGETFAVNHNIFGTGCVAVPW